MADEYLVVIDGKPEGPFGKEKMKEMGLKPGSFVKSAGMDDYKEAHEVEELCGLLGFTHTPVPLPQYYASLDIRLLASLIDHLLVFAVYVVVILITVSAVESKYLKIAFAITGIPLIPITKLIVEIFMEASSRQATFGKQWLGVKVTDERGNRLSLSRSAARNALKILSDLTLGIGYLMGFFHRKQQCLHDQIARTLVIKSRLV